MLTTLEPPTDSTHVVMKRCAKCNVEQPLVNFHRNAQTPDGRHRYCASCRGTKKRRRDTPTAIIADPQVWRQEFALVAQCVQCQKPASLPSSITNIDEARAHLKREPPTCDNHRHCVPTTKARLRARRWHEAADTTIDQIDAQHLITVVLRNFAPLRKTKGARAWLAGNRTDIHPALLEVIETWIERTANRSVIRDLNERFPIITKERRESIARHEVSSDYIDIKTREKHGDENFTSIIDLVLLSR